MSAMTLRVPSSRGSSFDRFVHFNKPYSNCLNEEAPDKTGEQRAEPVAARRAATVFFVDDEDAGQICDRQDAARHRLHRQRK